MNLILIWFLFLSSTGIDTFLCLWQAALPNVYPVLKVLKGVGSDNAK